MNALRNRSRSAFTLLELLFVVAIIATLAAMAIPNFLEAQTRTKVGRTWQDLFLLADRIDQYRVDQGEMPPNLTLNESVAISDMLLAAPQNGGIRGAASIPSPSAVAGAPARGSGSGVPLLDTNSYTLNRLTTPVAYLGNVPVDVFSTRRPAPFGKWGYHYWRLDAAQSASLDGAQAVLLSVGPDQLVSSDLSSQTVTLLRYDPTNGTNSTGDIILTLPESFEYSSMPD
jgi:prepilin-type N-terminal cleavage/methylation domain-containing protein